MVPIHPRLCVTSKRLGCIWVPVSRHRSACGIETADAQGFWYSGNSRPKRVVRQARPERAERPEKTEKVKDKASSRSRCISSSSRSPSSASPSTAPAASTHRARSRAGTPGFPTPTGVFSVIQKNRYHRSNIYSGAPMPFMQRITWSGVAMHEGVLPGYPASHGCIRLTHKFASELWGMTRMGVRVVVTPDDARARAGGACQAAGADHDAGADCRERSRADQALARRHGRGRSDGRSGRPRGAGQAAEPARARQGREDQIVAEAPAKAKAAKEAAEVSAAKASRPTRRSSALREADAALDAARDRLDAATKAVEQAKTPEAAERAKADAGRRRSQGRGGHAS